MTDIPTWFAFAGPSFAAPYPVLWCRLPGLERAAEPLPAASLEGANRLFREALGPDAEGLALREARLDRLLAETGIRLLQAARHPVARYGAGPAADGITELTVELNRPAAGEMLVELLISFHRALFDPALAGGFTAAYARCRKPLAYRLGELLKEDRMRMARMLGLAVRPERSSRAWIGQGAGRKLVAGGYSAQTSRLGKDLAGDKARSAQAMLQLGLPAAEQREAHSADQAVAAAEAIGYPVVVKPRDGNKGRGVVINLRTADEVRAGYREAAAVQPETVVERCIAGDDYRLLVAEGRFLAAVKRVPAQVVGDGVNSIAQLARILNERQRRDGLYLYPINIDSEIHRVLAAQRLTVDDVPAAGQVVPVRRAANQSLGGTTLDVTDIVHADNRAAAVAAARACQVDIGGIDFVTTDITRSWRDGFGGIVEINAGPGVDLHLAPSEGAAQEISWGILRTDFQPTERANQSTIAVVGQWNKSETALYCGALARRVGLCAATLLRDAWHRPGQTLSYRGSLMTTRHSAVEADADVDCVIAEWRSGALADEGAPLEAVDVVVLTDDRPRPDLDEVAPGMVARLRRMVADLATTAVVFDGRHEALLRLAAEMPAPAVRLCWPDAARTPPDAVLRHVERGGWLFQAGGDGVTVRQGQNACSLGQPREALNGNQLLALAAVSALEPDPEALRAAWAGLPAMGGAATSTWSARRSGDGRRLACGDPRDAEVLGELATWRGWVVTGGAGEPAPTAELAGLLARPEIRHCAVGPEVRSVEQALARIAADAAPADGVLLLLANEADRLRHFRALRAGAPPASLADLERRFAGCWVRGEWLRPLPLPSAGRIAVIPGRVADKAEQALVMTQLHDAFRKGCLGAIASGVADDLPRWWPVLVCDDPMAGWHGCRREMGDLLQPLS